MSSPKQRIHIVIKCIAEDIDPESCTAGELAEGKLVWVSADTNIMRALSTMEEHKVRRVPVIDSDRRLCGMLSQADIATHLDNREVGMFLSAISSGPPVQHAV